MKDIVLILAHDRPDNLRKCLGQVRVFAPEKDVWVCVDVHRDKPQPSEIGGELLRLAQRHRAQVIINEHESPGNTANTRMSLETAANEPDVRLIYLIEDDIILSSDFFAWSEEVHQTYNPDVVSGFHRAGELCVEGNPNICLQNAEFIHTFAVSFRRDVVKGLIPKLTKPLDAVLNDLDRNKRLMITPARSRCAHPGLGDLPSWEFQSGIRMFIPKLLVAVESCQRDLLLGCHETIRKTWGKDFPADIRFFVGGKEPPSMLRDDEVWLDVPDEYLELPKKTRAIAAWMLDRDYTHMMKVDCDTVIVEREFNKFDFKNYDYAGFWWAPIDAPGSAASGFCYYLSRNAAICVVNFNYEDARTVSQWAEDQMVGDAVRDGIDSGELKAYHIPVLVATASAGHGEPHEPKSPYPPGICEIQIEPPGQKPYTKVLPREKALWYVRKKLAKMIWPKG